MDRDKIIGAEQTRTLILERRLTQDEPDTLTFSVASETPVERWWGREILSHEPGAVNHHTNLEEQ